MIRAHPARCLRTCGHRRLCRIHRHRERHVADAHRRARHHGQRPGAQIVLDGFAELEPQPDATAAFRTLEAAGIGIVALSNGAAETTQRLLDRAGLAGFVQHVVSIAEIRAWKPLPAIYLHAAKRAGVAPGKMALVATHAWDVHRAKRAGLMTGFVARGQIFPSTMALPDVVGESLAEVAVKLAQ